LQHSVPWGHGLSQEYKRRYPSKGDTEDDDDDDDDNNNNKFVVM
jgi:hypothetical protein